MASYRLEDYDFVSLSKHAKKRRVHERLLILAHVKMGKSITQAADALYVGKPVVKRCLKNFFAKGLEGLEDKPRSGRPTRLAAAHHKDLMALIEASHESDSGGRLTGQDIANLIDEKWQVRYTVNGVYELLKSLRMSWVSSRSKHPKQNQQQQETFKKTLYQKR